MKKLLTFSVSSDIINNVKRNRQALYFFSFLIHRGWQAGCITIHDGFDSRPVNSSTDVKQTKKANKKEAKEMARKRMVTRTITSTKATATVYNIESGKIQTVEYKLSGELSADDALKAITKEHADVRPLKVTEVEVQEELYGMSEEKFLELAEILPTRAKSSDEKIM